MMVPGDRDEWVMLTIEPGTTFLSDVTVMACAQAALDGPEVTYKKVVNLLWAMATLASAEGEETVWPHELAQLITVALRDAHEQVVAEMGAEDLEERVRMGVVEVKRVLEQMEADINAKAAAEVKRMRVRRDA